MDLEVSIVILNYNGQKYIERCLNSVLSSNHSSFQVIFVDNASTDSSLENVVERYGGDDRLVILPNKYNVGYAEGNNLGAQMSSARFLVFLNVDTEVEPNWLGDLLEPLFADANVAATQPKLLLYQNRNVIDSCGHMLTPMGLTVEIGAREVDQGQYDAPIHMFSVKGAAFAVRRDIFRSLGGFDPTFFLLREETDLCWRIWLSGYSVGLAPKSRVYHFGGGSVKESRLENLWPSRTMVLWYRNSLLTILKNAEGANVVRLCIPLVIVSLGDGLVELVSGGRPSKIFSLVLGLSKVMQDFRGAWKSRLRVQHLRKKSDRELSTQIMVRISPRAKFQELRRLKSTWTIGRENLALTSGQRKLE